MIQLGTEALNQEKHCAYSVCADYPTYLLDYQKEICYCYENDEIKYQEYVG